MGKNQASEMFCSKLIRCKSPCRLQNLKILLILWGHKNPCGQNFWNWNFFIPEKLRLYRYYQNKNQLGFTLSSYINITMKLLIKSENSPKSRVKMKFYIFGKLSLSFASDTLFIFSDFIVLRGMMQIN